MNAEWDAFGDPHSEDFQDHDLDESTEIHDPVGASPVSVADVSGKPNRKGLYMIVAAIVVFIGIWVFAKKFEKPNESKDGASQVATQTQSNGGVAVAKEEDQEDISDVLGALPSAQQPRRESASKGQLVTPNDLRRQSGSNASSPTQSEDPVDLFGELGVPSPMQEPSPARSSDPIAESLAGDDLMLPAAQEPQAQEQPGEQASFPTQRNAAPQRQTSQQPSANDTYVEPEFMTQAARQAALEEQLRREAEQKAREEAKAAERERLRAAGTLIAEAKSSSSSMSTMLNPQMQEALEGTLGPEQGAQVAAAIQALEAQSQSSGTASTGGRDAATGLEVTPGLKVQAITVSEFIAGQQGGGVVEARLTSALRDRGRLVLPAGTRAFGEARATNWSPGRDARVSITFHTFVTPNGQVLRNQLTAMAADPQTLAMSVRGSVDHNYLSKIARGGAATAIDLFLTQDAARRSVFDAPSPRDQALADARERLGNVLGADIGDETTDRPVVTLPAQTPLMLVFGLSER